MTDLDFFYLLLQLRNLVWATSKHDVYLMSHFSVIHWSSLACSKSEVLDVSGHVAPCEVSVSVDDSVLLICYFVKALNFYFIFHFLHRNILEICWKGLLKPNLAR